MLIAFFSSSIVLNNSDHRFFYQSYFEPAAHIACDHGFIVTEPSSNPALNDFLLQKRDKITCNEILTTEPISDPRFTPWFYMMSATGLVWKYLGISWKNVDILSALLFSFTIAFSFGLLRLGSNKWIAFLCTLLFCFSTQHTRYLFYLRDYSIAPFMLASVFFLGLVISRPMSFLHQILCFIALGITIGVGYGFRPDIIILLPYSFITILFFLPGFIYKSIQNKLLFLFTFVISFIIAAWPMLQNSMHSDIGGGTFHFLLLGLSPVFSNELHIVNQIYYDVIYQFNDILAYAMTIANGYHLNGTIPNYIDKLYDFAGFDIYKNYILTFPFDYALRAFSSVIHILAIKPIISIANHFINFPRLGFISTFMTAGLLLFYQPRIGLFYIFSIFYLLAYPALAFHERHFFYLYVAYWWPIGFLISNVYSVFSRPQNRQDFFRRFKINASIAIMLGGCTLLFLLTIMLSLYIIQNKTVSQLIQAYLNAPTQKLTLSATQNKDTTTYLLNQQEMMAPLSFIQSKSQTFYSDYTYSKMLKVSFDLSQCRVKNDSIPLALNYHYPLHQPNHNFSRKLEIASNNMSEIIFAFIPVYIVKENHNIPVLKSRYFYPISLSLPSQYQKCLKEVAYVSNTDFHPLWISIIIPKKWNSSMLHSSINWRR